MIHETFCSTWFEYKRRISDLALDSEPHEAERYLFRGQGNAKWRLSSSFSRAFASYPPEKQDDIEEKLLANFGKELEGHPEFRDLASDRVSLTALAQHSGVPTRLLDWTESPYVAAFFAFQGHFYARITQHVPEQTVAVWALDSNSHVWSERQGVRLISVPGWYNERVRAQYGAFTESRTPFSCLEEYVEQFDDPSEPLQKFVMSSTLARTAMADLHWMGIRHSALFPGLDGHARAAITRTMLAV
ncbi:MAG: FRG domain-containing protein [Gemmatimonadales bacterium]